MSGKFTPIPAEVLAGLTSEARAGLLEGQRLALKQAALRSGRKVGVKNNKTPAIENLIKRNLKKFPKDRRTAPNLRLRAERTATGRKLLKDMAPSTWARHVKNVLNLASE